MAKIATCDPTNKLPHDCNDNDPHVFPGAPDKCNTPAAEHCATTPPCGVDADGDGYDVSADCNDGDAAVHPWATELCNGKDDDCDGLVDEGNPDDAGLPMVAGGAVLHCTDSSVGECARAAGDC